MNIIDVLTEYPVALDSRDHLQPGGTRHDNSRNQKFNDKLYEMYPAPISILDLGCAGGGFVANCIHDGHDAVGLEGSDYSLIRKRAEWATIPERLFTCDVTKPFQVLEDGEPKKFQVVTAWEIMEHILEQDLPQMAENVRNHLTDDGIWIMSVSTQVGYHHVTVQRRGWWEDFFARLGWKHNQKIVAKFNQDWIRGPYPGQNAPQSFHLILSVG